MRTQNFVRSSMQIVGAMVALSSVAATAAEVTEFGSAGSLAYVYAQDVDSSAQDLDSNATSDFFTGNPSEHPVVAGGIASFSDGDFYRTDFTDSITRASFADNDVFTIDIRAQMLTTGSADGTNGTMHIFWRDNGAADDTGILYVGDSFVKTHTGATISTADNTDAFHDFRITRDADGEFWYYRDGVLLARDVASSTIAGADGLFVGDATTSTQGDWSLDYLAIGESALAPNVVVDNLDLSGAITSGSQSSYRVQSFTPNVAAIGINDTVDENAPLPAAVALESATFMRAPSGTADAGQLFIDVYLGDGDDGTYLGSSTNSIDVNSAAALAELTWFFDDLVLDSTAEYALVFSSDAVEGAAAVARLTAANNGGGFVNTYDGGTASINADGSNPVAFDTRFAVRFTPIPAPAALPAGLAMLGFVAARRRRNK